LLLIGRAYSKLESGVEQLLGYREQEFVGQNVSIIFTLEDVENDAHQKEIKTAVANGRAEDQGWHLRKDGTQFFSNDLVMLLRDNDGNVTALTKIMRDETTPQTN